MLPQKTGKMTAFPRNHRAEEPNMSENNVPANITTGVPAPQKAKKPRRKRSRFARGEKIREDRGRSRRAGGRRAVCPPGLHHQSGGLER